MLLLLEVLLLLHCWRSCCCCCCCCDSCFWRCHASWSVVNTRRSPGCGLIRWAPASAGTGAAAAAARAAVATAAASFARRCAGSAAPGIASCPLAWLRQHRWPASARLPANGATANHCTPTPLGSLVSVESSLLAHVPTAAAAAAVLPVPSACLGRVAPGPCHRFHILLLLLLLLPPQPHSHAAAAAAFTCCCRRRRCFDMPLLPPPLLSRAAAAAAAAAAAFACCCICCCRTCRCHEPSTRSVSQVNTVVSCCWRTQPAPTSPLLPLLVALYPAPTSALLPRLFALYPAPTSAAAMKRSLRSPLSSLLVASRSNRAWGTGGCSGRQAGQAAGRVRACLAGRPKKHTRRRCGSGQQSKPAA